MRSSKKNSSVWNSRFRLGNFSFSLDVQAKMLCFRQIACSVFWVFTLVELEFMKLEFHWIFFFPWTCRQTLFQADCLLYFWVFTHSGTRVYETQVSLGIFFFFPWTYRQTRNWSVCTHLLRNRDREAENVIHKHSLRGREAKNVNALKLHQKAFSIGTKL